ncbi:tctex1 domain-containing protein 1-like [Hyposmocoma kahamanoa]|uniref:tctex1 domain-containing protein 1-like n=1 Tax=Hyposmocoma kahamanoa TaxID=1477025 RepID=UPI000E6D5E1E|nr:tctex1 domain-containing protein 1-like [Hyposmocoma kahamanoa]
MSVSNIGLARSQPSVGGINKADRAATSRLQIRRQSYGFRTEVPGVRPVEGRSSQVGFEFKRPILAYFPTYQLNPCAKFNTFYVTKMAQLLLEENFTGHKYNSVDTPNLALRTAYELMKRVKTMNFNRYRIISIVTIGQKRSQSYNNAITLLWDDERDDYVDVHKELSTCFIQATIFGIYLD